ncbi:MAG: restriction endonuclease subunit S [Sciscionella sp.]
MGKNDWPKVSLGDIAKEVTVGHVGPMVSEYVAEGIPFLRSQNVERLRIDLQDTKFIAPSFHNRLKKSALSPGDVVIVRTGKPGACAVIPKSLPISNCSDLVIVRPGPNLDSRFLAYYVDSVAAQIISAYQVGAVQQHFNVRSARNLKLALPPLPEQEAIASILYSLDDRIELNRRVNDTLEATARAIFKSWFVDFDPVRAKAERRQPFGMNAETAVLFPNSFEDSVLGRIPKGWKTTGLDQIASFLNGLALQKFPANGDDFLPAIKIAQLRRGTSEGADRISREIPADYIVHDGDVLFSWSGSLEVIVWCGGPGALNQHLFKVSSADYPKWFYYYWTKEHLADFQHIAAGKATTMGHIQRHHLSDAKVIVPPQPLVHEADRIISPIFQLRIMNSLESRTLASLRDALLPKLVSGEIHIKDAEKIVEERV